MSEHDAENRMLASTSSPELLTTLERIAARAWEQGCPVAGSTPEARRRLAELAARRWRSFDSRARKRRDQVGLQIEDLARGLAEALEPAPVGPLREDYRWLAAQLASAWLTDARA